jgi:hypothetical protein
MQTRRRVFIFLQAIAECARWQSCIELPIQAIDRTWEYDGQLTIKNSVFDDLVLAIDIIFVFILSIGRTLNGVQTVFRMKLQAL